jgi:hypothetical protein
MKCPRCKRPTIGQVRSVIDSRPTTKNEIRRRRQCECGSRFTTYEVIEPGSLDPDPEWLDVAERGSVTCGEFVATGDSMRVKTTAGGA